MSSAQQKQEESLMTTNPGSQKISGNYTEKREENTIETDDPGDIEDSRNSMRVDRKRKKSNLRKE